MPNFRYRGRGAGGRVVEGVLDAPTLDAVATQLIGTGVTPIDIREVAGGADVFRRDLFARRPSLEELVLFARQMYTLMRAGVPINQAMTGLVRSTRNQVLADILRDVQSSLESGRELSTALAQYPRVFSPLFVNTVRIGETTGRLDDAFLKLAEHLDRDRDTRARINSAMRYPIFVIVAIGIAIGIINVVVIPQFAAVFARAGVDLPLPTRIIVATSDFFVAWWLWLLLALVAAIAGFLWWKRTPAGRYTWDRLKLRIPIVGDILYRATLGRFARGFAMSLAAGVTLPQALAVVSRAVDNEYIGEQIRAMRTGIERGETLSRTAASTGMFSPLVLQMLVVGEETGSVDDLLAEAASYYEREVDYDVKNLAQTIEPVLIVALAGIVLVFALGVFLPMWDLAAIKLSGGR